MVHRHFQQSDKRNKINKQKHYILSVYTVNVVAVILKCIPGVYFKKNREFGLLKVFY